MKTLIKITCILVLIGLMSCIKKASPGSEKSLLIEISSKQFLTDSMALGEPQKRIFERIVKCNGIVQPAPNGILKLTGGCPGIVKKICCHNGDDVNKGQLLLEISGNELLDLQKEFAESSAFLKKLHSDYQRTKSLFEDKVAAEKDLIAVEAEFKIAQAKYSSLKIKLENLGLEISAIENGKFASFYSIYAPQKGQIASLNVNNGHHIDLQSVILDIIDPESLEVKLSVFQHDLLNLQVGQLIRLKPSNAQTMLIAKLQAIGIMVDKDTKTIDCYANISEKKGKLFVANTFVDAEIITKSDSAYAVPSGCLIKNDDGNQVLMIQKTEGNSYFFKKVKVKTSRESDGYTEIEGGKPEGKILIKGTYNLSI